MSLKGASLCPVLTPCMQCGAQTPSSSTREGRMERQRDGAPDALVPWLTGPHVSESGFIIKMKNHNQNLTDQLLKIGIL